MGTSCSSLKKEDKHKSSVDSGPPINEERRSSSTKLNNNPSNIEDDLQKESCEGSSVREDEIHRGQQSSSSVTLPEHRDQSQGDEQQLQLSPQQQQQQQPTRQSGGNSMVTRQSTCDHGDNHHHQYDKIFLIKGNDAHVIAISTGRGEISVWNIAKQKAVRKLTGVNQPKDLQMIDQFRAVVLCNRDLRIYNLDEGTLEIKLKGVMNQKMPFFGLQSENYLVALSRNRMYVNMLSLKTGDLETTFKVGEDRFLNSLLVSANGNICVCGDETQKPFPLLVWDLINRKLIYDLRIPHYEFITKLSAISDDGHYVVCVSKELNSTSPNFIIVYDLQSGTLFKKWKPEHNTVSITISTGASCVINCIETALILVWDLSTGAKRLTLQGHLSFVDILQVDERGQTLLSYDSTGKDHSIRLWDLKDGTCFAVFTPDQPLSCCQLSRNGKSVVVCLTDTLQLLTLVLCTDTNPEEEIAPYEALVYGSPEREFQEFDLSKEG